MAYTYQQILQSQYEAKAGERALALADLEAARINEDPSGTMDAANRILEVDKSVTALDRIAQTYVAGQQQPQGNRWNLSAEEMEVAKASHSAGTAEERIEEYARNKQRYHHLRATGQYSDQGRSR